jgi:hypothetical protein
MGKMRIFTRISFDDREFLEYNIAGGRRIKERALHLLSGSCTGSVADVRNCPKEPENGDG